jgi:hypothetical protein
VRVQEVSWEGGGTEPAGEYTFFYEKGNENRELGTGSDRMSYIILRGHWCHIIVLNDHTPTEDKTDDVNDSF